VSSSLTVTSKAAFGTASDDPTEEKGDVGKFEEKGVFD